MDRAPFLAASATAMHRSFTSLAASTLKSPLKFTLCAPTHRFRQTPYVCDHEAGGRLIIASERMLRRSPDVTSAARVFDRTIS